MIIGTTLAVERDTRSDVLQASGSADLPACSGSTLWPAWYIGRRMAYISSVVGSSILSAFQHLASNSSCVSLASSGSVSSSGSLEPMELVGDGAGTSAGA